MTFPFVIELEQKIKTTDDTVSLLNVFTIVQTYLKSKSVDNFYKTENTIKFKQSFFTLNTNVFATIDKGEFELIENNGEFKLKYRFYMLWFFIISSTMSICFGIFTGQLIFAIVVFFVSVIGNFLICWVRQKGVMNDIVYNIDEAYRNRKTATVNPT
jgi:hypothetical protein